MALWSQGASQARAADLLGQLRQNWRTGQGSQSLKEMREANRAAREAKVAAREAKVQAEARLENESPTLEIFSLTRADVNFDQKMIFIKDSKNRKLNRHAYMTGEIEAMLKRRSEGRSPAALSPAALVFPKQGRKPADFRFHYLSVSVGRFGLE